MLQHHELLPAFNRMFGIDNPHDFQIEVAERLLIDRKSVILQAPTGSGKTWTALFPFLHAWQANLTFPRKCLYAVPLRVLATQFKADAERLSRGWPRKPEIRLQTGEQQEDPTFESDLIFTTIDQVLSSALSVPYSLGNRRANVNAGAVFSSYLVCDELHLFPVDKAKAQGALVTLIELLRTVGDAIPFLLMTATLSEEMLDTVADQLNAVPVRVTPDQLPKIGSQRKTRRYQVVAAPLSAESVLRRHRTRSVVICNQVARAIQFLEDLDTAVKNDPAHAGRTEIALLHSRFIQKHRQGKEAALRAQFGNPVAREGETGSRIIVATQAIEVGLDITCEQLHTELAPANAIIQRAGRCARYEGEEGDVQIYKWPEDAAHPWLPYDADRCQVTWEAFSDPCYNGKALSFTDEQRIVTQVHNAADKRLLDKIEREGHNRWRDMSAAMFRGDRKGRTRLIRKVDSRTLLVHAEPNTIQNPYAWSGFSLFHGMLRGWFHKLQQADGPSAEWWFRYPVESDDASEDSRKQPRYAWHDVTVPDHFNVSPLFVVNPDLVAYDRRRGFRLMPSETPINVAELGQQPSPGDARSPFLTHYSLETYGQHIELMFRYYETSGLEQQVQLAGQRLASAGGYGCTAEQLGRAVRLALVLHDVGKLQVEWQQWSHAYQTAIGAPTDPSWMIVHTDYRPHDIQFGSAHIEAERTVSKQFRRPHHAAEGACASWPLIVRALEGNEPLSRAVFTAIARHHAPFVDQAERYKLHERSQAAIVEALDHADIAGDWVCEARMAGSQQRNTNLVTDDGLIREDSPTQWLVYTIVVRALRLCDGHALEGGA